MQEQQFHSTFTLSLHTFSGLYKCFQNKVGNTQARFYIYTITRHIHSFCSQSTRTSHIRKYRWWHGTDDRCTTNYAANVQGADQQSVVSALAGAWRRLLDVVIATPTSTATSTDFYAHVYPARLGGCGAAFRRGGGALARGMGQSVVEKHPFVLGGARAVLRCRAGHSRTALGLWRSAAPR